MEPQNALRRIFEFLDVDRGFKVKDLMPRNVTMAKHAVNPYILEYLDDYFLPHNKSLDGLVGNRYDWEIFGRTGSSTRA